MQENINTSFNTLTEEEGFRLSDLVELVTKHVWWYVGVTLCCLLFAAYYLYKTPVLYNRSAKVMVDDSGQDAAMRNLGMASANMMRMRSFNGVMNELEAFGSPDLMRVVVERLGLQTRYVQEEFLRTVELYHNSPVEMRLAGMNPSSGFSVMLTPAGEGQVSLSEFKVNGTLIEETVTGSYGDTLSTPAGSLAIYARENIADFHGRIRASWTNSAAMAKAYAGKVSLSLSGKESTVVVISMNDQFPSRADAVISTLIDVYNEQWIYNKNRSAISTAAFINERLVVIEQDLGTVENALKEYKQNNNITDLMASAERYMNESSIYAGKAFEVTNQISVARYIKEYLNNPETVNDLIPSNLGLTSGSVESQIREYNELVLQRDRLLAGSSLENPLVADLTVSLASIRTAILSSVENLIATLTLQLDRIKGQEQQILSRMSSNSGRELQLLSLEREQKMIQNLYVFLLQKREENELAALVNVGNTRLIMSPTGSGAPVSPDRKMVILAALILGLGLPFAYFFLMKMLDTSVKTKADLGNLSVPFLAELPRYESPEERFRKFKWLRRKVSGTPDMNRIIVEHGSRDMMNEAFRVLRTNVDLMIGKKKGSQVLMFTSFNPAAGKTFTVMNLASGMALKGAKVLMIDLDLRKASLSKSLDVVHSGVAAYLNDKVDDYRAYVEELSPNLWFLPVGTLPPNPTELLLTERFRDMIASMRQEYDYIFLDCPPIDIVADASIITELADMTVFVMRAGNMDKKVLPNIEELYASRKYTQMTMILNGVDIKYKKYGYGKSSYGYGYGYGNASIK